MRKLLYIIGIIGLVSCTKEISIDYHGHDTRYVVEGSIDNDGTEVRVSQTNAMENNAIGSDIDNATVTITGDDGTTDTIPLRAMATTAQSLQELPVPFTSWMLRLMDSILPRPLPCRADQRKIVSDLFGRRC